MIAPSRSPFCELALRLALSNDIGLECADQLLENGDFRPDLVSRLRIAHRAWGLVYHDGGHRRNDVGVLLDRGLGALEVVVLRQVDALRVEHERESLVAVRGGERTAGRDGAPPLLDRRLSRP